MNRADSSRSHPATFWACLWRRFAKKENEGPNWEALADKLNAVGTGMLDANIPWELRSADPKFMCLALLARTLSNFQSARILLMHGQLLEALVLSRCCHENLFWIAALSKRGVEFVDDMFSDGTSHIRKQARRLLPEETFNFDMTGGRPEAINHLQAARQGDVADAYVNYARLSAEAAHPSVFSLGRHMEKTADGRGFVGKVQGEMFAKDEASR